MLNFLKKLFSPSSALNYRELVHSGAMIVDVRTPSEYSQGHIQGSVNIPLQKLDKSIAQISKDTTIITCCASGMRSATAKSILLSAGFNKVYNGGGWLSLNQSIQS